MNNLEAIRRIQESKASENVKEVLCRIASDFECFLQIKRKHWNAGLQGACYKELGVKFMGMYGISKIEDLVKKAESNNLLA